jgi:hypothetical protein
MHLTGFVMPIKFAEQFKATFDQVMQDFNASPAIEFLRSNSFKKEHYMSALREFYHYTKENPQMQTLATVYFRGSDRQMAKAFIGHARSEVGHDRMALDDLRALGGEVADIAGENPLPATSALTAFGFFQIQHRNPIGYLGYIYFLEYMPTAHGATYAQALMNANVPKEALSFLQEHIAVDVGHNKLMDRYLDHLVHDQQDADAACYAMRVAGELYANMLWSAIRRVGSSVSYGTAWHETTRTRTDFASTEDVAADDSH